jgi:hypothetical protein
MKMNSFEQKQEAKRERLENAAARAQGQAAAAFKRADLRESASGIPMGQPILIGHHSEGRHRAAIKRADNAMRASIEASKRAADLAGRAAAVGSGGISADDPDACDKLAEKLASAVGRQAFMIAANKVIKAAIKAGMNSESPIEDLAPWMEKGKAATGLPWGEGSIRGFLKPDCMRQIGFASYQLSNNNANIARMRKRLAQLESQRLAVHKEQDCDGFRLVENVEENRIQLVFPGKPSADVRAALKGHGFRWAPSAGAWQRQLNNAARHAAKQVIAALAA